MEQTGGLLKNKPDDTYIDQKKFHYSTGTGGSHYFMSANTPVGFISLFGHLYDAEQGWRAYLVKGYSEACSKALEQTGESFASSGEPTELIHCASNPLEVCGIALPSRKTCIINNLPPHVIAAKYPGVVEIESYSSPIDENGLFRRRGQILTFSTRASQLYDRAYRFLCAAAGLARETCSAVCQYTDIIGIDQYAESIASRVFEKTPGKGREHVRFLSGITCEGVVCFSQLPASSYRHVYVIRDIFGCGRILLHCLRQRAIACGLDVISCLCPLLYGSKKLEHLLIPSLSLAFVTENSYFSFARRGCRHINMSKFIDMGAFRVKSPHTKFAQRASRDFITHAEKLLADARRDDQIVMECYSACSDDSAFASKLQELYHTIVNTV